ncbi:MAG: hypothetical protein U0270_20325 [Labilithrix sp.]
MKRVHVVLAAVVLGLLSACHDPGLGAPPEVPPPPPHDPEGARPLEPEPEPEPVAPPAVGSTTTTSAEPTPPASTVTITPAAPPPLTERTATYATGRWVYADGHGWIWVPNDAGNAVVDGVPYVYLYTPSYGWSWYVSPWGYGPYVYGVWVLHPWRPAGWRGAWVARPGVVYRIGGAYHGHGHGGYHPPPPAHRGHHR